MMTIERLKQLLNIDENNNSYDEVLGEIINSSYLIIENYIGRKISADTYIEHHYGTNSRKMVLDEYPVLGLVYVKDETGNDIADKVTIYKRDIGLLLKTDFWYADVKYEIKYKAGYEIMPKGIRYAQKLICLQMFGSLDKGTSIVSPDGAINYNIKSIPKQAFEVLETYKKK